VIVADTNLVVCLVVESERTRLAREVWKADPEWRLPPLWRSEFLNVLWFLVERSVLTRDQAVDAWYFAVDLLGSSELDVDGESVLLTAISRGISAYDAQFVALASALGTTLVTEDRRVLSRCRDLAVSCRRFLSS
jgi:predicted nucleic acid-binding protein